VRKGKGLKIMENKRIIEINGIKEVTTIEETLGVEA